MYYVGIDHHKKLNAVTVVDKEGTILKRARLSNEKDDLDSLFHSLGEPCSVVFESSRDWTVLYDKLENLVSDIHPANPYKIRAIAEAKVKTDKIDSGILAHLLRSNMIPESHIPFGRYGISAIFFAGVSSLSSFAPWLRTVSIILSTGIITALP